MPVATHRHLVDFEEFCKIIPDRQKADLIDGVIYVASPDNIEHFDLFLWLAHLLRDFLKWRRLGGKILGSRIAFRLNKHEAPEPDLAYLMPSRAHLVRRGYVAGRPDVAMEIVSPDSIERDYDTKREQFRAAGVPEYWIIDLLAGKVICLRLTKSDEYRPAKSKDGKLYSSIIQGFWVRPEWLLRRPLPDKDDVLTEILASLDTSGNGK